MDPGKQPLADFIRNNTPQLPVVAEVLEAIVEPFEERSYSKGDLLLQAGRVSGYHYVHSGYLRAFTHDPEGNEVTTYFYPAGRVAFDPPSFFFGQPSLENHQALSDCHCYYINFEQLNRLFHALPVAREFGRAMLVREFTLYKQRSLAMIHQRAEERYAHLLATQPDVFQHAQLKQIASFLGVTDSSLSRIRREFAGK
ncbi:MAG: Crp/Fnr family transcriptional regulator [Chitinophagaceae bacterium]|nr:MAG: Crp/Fnr family transcriptional regulator [Chitinophagaceae bacterium]